MKSILVVDDEAPARGKIVQFIKRLSVDFEIAEANSAHAAKQWLPEADLVFLDIQMPGQDAFAFIEQIGIEHFPPIIFTTAYHEYALQAFEIHAIDYLLKPYTFDRFKAAFDHAMDSIDHVSSTKRMLADLLKRMPAPNVPKEIWVRHQNKLIPLPIEHISLLESDGNYVQVFCGAKKYLIRESLKKMEEKLQGSQFVRVHRSTLLNKSFLQEMVPRGHGDLTGVLKGGGNVVISRRYRDRLLDLD